MRWSSYHNECMRVLTESESIADKLLVHLVQFQRVHEKVIHAPWHDIQVPALQSSDDMFEITKTTTGAPASFYVRALQSDLNQARKEIPTELLQNEVLMLYGYNVELSIHEAALSKNLDPAFDRLESLWAALQAAKSWFDLFFRIPPAGYISISMAIFAQFAHCLVALSRLSSFEHPHWDLELARKTCNLSEILDRVIDKFARVKAEVNLDVNSTDDNDVFSSNARRITAIKQWWSAKLAAEQPSASNNAEAEPTMAEQHIDENAGNADPMLSGPPIDFSDDTWLRDIMSLDDFQFSQYLQ